MMYTIKDRNLVMRIDLLYLASSERTTSWQLGNVKYLGGDLRKAKRIIEHHMQHLVADFILVINLDLFEIPDKDTLLFIITQKPGELWHVGLKCYREKILRVFEFVRPTWIYSLKPPDDISSTSWYLTAECFLARAEVFQKNELFDTSFKTISGAGIDLGYRLYNSGVIIRYEPLLSVFRSSKSYYDITMFDEFRFVKRNFSLKWYIWSAWRYFRKYMTLKTIVAILIQ